MADKNSNIDKFFNERLTGHQVKAPAGAWERLHDELHKTNTVRLVWIWRSAAAAILLLITFTAGYYFSDYQKDNIQQLASSQPTELAQPEAGSPDPDLAGISIPDTQSEIAEEKSEKIILAQADFEQSNSLQSQNLQLSDESTEATAFELTSQSPDEQALIDPEKRNEIGAPEELPTLSSEILIQDEIAEEFNQPENHLFDDPEFLKQMLLADERLALDLNDQPEKGATSNWSIGGRLSPLYSYRTLNEGSYDTGNEEVAKEYFDEVESGLLTIAGGISLNYKFSERWSLGSGMYVSRIGQENSQVLAFAAPGGSGMYKLATSAGAVTINPAKFQSVMVEQQVSVKDTIPGGYIVSGDFVQNLDYFEVPFIMHYKVTDHKFSVLLMGGISPGILVNNRSYFKTDGQKVQTGIIEDVNPMIYNSLVGFGLEYLISEKVSLNFDPTFKYSLSPVNNSNNMSAHPYSISFFTGITYKFY